MIRPIYKLILFVAACVLAPSHLLAADFSDQVDLSRIEIVAVQHRQTIKTFDSYARQVITDITGRSSLRDTRDATIDGKAAAYSVLDMSFRPDRYLKLNLIKIRNVPLRNDFRTLEGLSEDEKERIVKAGTISLEFWERNDVQRMLEHQMAIANRKVQAIRELQQAANELTLLLRDPLPLSRLALVVPTDPSSRKWSSLFDLANGEGAKDRENFMSVSSCIAVMRGQWLAGDANAVNGASSALARTLADINPTRYPSELKRRTEVIYNRLARLTIPGAALYFAAFVCFLMSARAGVGSLRLWGLRLFVVALLVHTTGIAIRWWLIEKSVGSWFDAIPIKNQFESVLMSAWFGCVVGLILEIRRSRGIFGAAASFVGWMSLIAIFSAPFWSGKEIGGNIGQVSGVLMSYWLYIHVTLVTASYALIGMGFLLSLWWLYVYYRQHGTLSRAAEASRTRVKGSLVAATPGALRQIARGLHVPAGAIPLPAEMGFPSGIEAVLHVPAGSGVESESAKRERAHAIKEAEEPIGFLATLDLCNLVILQLAFWVLGVGIICGAIWADMSWGRPWGWDPKETFALVTWIVYLIVVHVRVATSDEAWWTAVLSVVGFVVMLFNWIGVNFFLVGLHSYA